MARDFLVIPATSVSVERLFSRLRHLCHEARSSDVWTFLQIFLQDSRFVHLAAQDLAIWTESYGGHYGPTFAAYFLAQNAAISENKIFGLTLNLKTLGIGNGVTDPISQYPGYITYAANNPYHPLATPDVVASANATWNMPVTGCKAQIIACNNGGSNAVCSSAQNFCNNLVLSPLYGKYDPYYVLAERPDSYPLHLTSYLASIQTKIGAQGTWQETNFDVYNHFAATGGPSASSVLSDANRVPGDWMRTVLPDLESVITQASVLLSMPGMPCDYIVNFIGVEAMVASLQTNFSAQFDTQVFAPYNVNGMLAGQFKNAGTFSYVRIYGAGHEVPAYKNGTLATGQAAFQFFSQTMAHEPLSST
ncbi:Alpha/Beta hydrolase protein [Mycena galopus ATCC 62051]|nr:Alpha/Beta hydrolase protein [Mycena galopus ATCC 62051]